jgi:sortase A
MKGVRIAFLVVVCAAVAAAGLWRHINASTAAASDAAYAAARARLTPAALQHVDPAALREPESGDLIGLLEIPRLGVSSLLVEGDSDPVLKHGVGHLPDTPYPWEIGNSAVAAHRTTDFRPLERIREGDTVWITTPRGDIEYHVREMMIVDPDDLSVLEPTMQPTLTLITCYPFDYVGNAPRRFIVRAERADGGPGA